MHSFVIVSHVINCMYILWQMMCAPACSRCDWFLFMLTPVCMRCTPLRVLITTSVKGSVNNPVNTAFYFFTAKSVVDIANKRGLSDKA